MRKAHKDREPDALRWKPRMKNAAGRSRSLSATGTAHVADQALSGMCTIDKLRSQGRDVEESYVAKLAGQGLRSAATPAAASALANRGSKATAARSRRRILGITAVVACTAAAAMVAYGMGGFSSRHTVAGKVWLERRPLGTAEVRFHPADNGNAAATVIAAHDGKFELKGIPPGKYRVTVHPSADSAVVPIAANYTKPEATPFQVHVHRDVDSLQLYASRVLPKARKATWTPGID